MSLSFFSSISFQMPALFPKGTATSCESRPSQPTVTGDVLLCPFISFANHNVGAALEFNNFLKLKFCAGSSADISGYSIWGTISLFFFFGGGGLNNQFHDSLDLIALL